MMWIMMPMMLFMMGWWRTIMILWRGWWVMMFLLMV